MSRRPRIASSRRLLVALAAGATLLASAIGASAYFTASGSARATSMVGSLSAPRSVAATQSAATVAITWGAAELSNGATPDGYRVTRSDGATICGASSLVTALTCTDTSPVAGASYTYTVTAVYRSWSAATTGTTITILSTPSFSSEPSNPSANTAPSIAFSGGGGSGYQCRLDSGSYTACSSPYAPGTLSSGSHTVSVRALSGGSTGPLASDTWTVDPSAPTISSEPVNPNSSTTASFSFSHTQAAYTFKCQLDGGSYAACTSPKSYSGLASSSHTFNVEAISADGAASAVASDTWAIDTTPPSTPSFSFSGLSSNAFYSSGQNTLYFRPASGGGYTVTAASTDTQTGIEPGNGGYTFSSLSTNGFTLTQNAGQASYTFGTTATKPASAPTVYATNNVGLNSSTASYNLIADTTAPTGGALTVNGTAASVAGSTSTATSTSFAISSRTDYSETQSTTQSGLASSILSVQSATYSNGACGTAGSGGPFTSATLVSATTQPSGIQSGYCYTYTLTGTDNVGNTVSISTTVALDTSSPATPTLAFSGLSSNAFYSSSEGTLYFRPATGGAYTVTATATDTTSGIKAGNAGYTFSSLSTNGFTLSQTAGQGSYTFGTTATKPSSAPTIYATNNVGLSSSTATYNLIADTTAPTGGALTINSTAASAGGSTSTATSTSFAISSRTDYSEAQSTTQSGLASSILSVQSATYANGACGAAGSGGPFTSATVVVGTTQPSGIVSGYCYTYTLTGTDNVGNSTHISTTVELDTSSPATPTLAFSGLANALYSSTYNTLYFRPATGGAYTVTATATDTTSGIKAGNAGYTFSSLSTNGFTLSQTAGQGSYTFGTTATKPSTAPTIYATNNVGLSSSTATYNLIADTTAPTGGALTINSTAASSGDPQSDTTSGITINSRTDYIEAQSATASGLAASVLTVQSASMNGGYSCRTVGSGGPFTTATTVTGTTVPSGATSGYCYTFTLTGTDSVGNTVSISTTVAWKQTF